MRSASASIAAILILISFTVPRAFAQEGQNSQSREFIMSCTYGVLAGTLVGAASLAFTNKPGDNMNHVARGASIGLYTGILLGVYVVYIVPGMESDPEEDPVARLERVPLVLEPTLNASANPDGAQVGWKFFF